MQYMKEVGENNPLVFVATTTVLMHVYGLSEILNLVGEDNLYGAISKCLMMDGGEQRMNDFIRAVGFKLETILKQAGVSLEEAIPTVMKKATELVAA